MHDPIGAGLVTGSCDQPAHRLRLDVDTIEAVPASVTLRMSNTHFLRRHPRRRRQHCLEGVSPMGNNCRQQRGNRPVQGKVVQFGFLNGGWVSARCQRPPIAWTGLPPSTRNTTDSADPLGLLRRPFPLSNRLLLHLPMPLSNRRLTVAQPTCPAPDELPARALRRQSKRTAASASLCWRRSQMAHSRVKDYQVIRELCSRLTVHAP
jgi:hypothetical protein